jgi:hypothetical protein
MMPPYYRHDMIAPMHPRLEAIADELRNAQAHLHRLAAAVPAERWAERSNPSRWSVAECVAHINLTSHGFRSPVERALNEGRQQKDGTSASYRRDPLGWFLWRIMAPPVQLVRVKTTPSFVPQSTPPAAQLLAEFDHLQQEQIGWVRAADGLPLGRLWIASPFNPRVKYNLYSCLSILPRHQERHIWQAEQAAALLATNP